jgi:high affinity Mn2+ porin
MRVTMRPVSWVLVVLLLLLHSAWAQMEGRISGVVSDPSGAFIAVATATLNNLGNGTKQTTITSDQGQYSFPVVAVGQYELEIASPGFQPYKKIGVVIDVNGVLRIDAILQTAQRTQSAQVTNVPTASESTQTDKSDDTSFGLMHYLSKNGRHDVHNETWNLYGQLTAIGFDKPSFHAAYTNLNGSNSSLNTYAEQSYTQTLTLFFGLRLRPGTDLYIVPEEISELTLSKLKGLGGATENFELQKVGSVKPTIYRSRFFLRQTFGFGGQSIELPSGQMQLGEHVDSRRLVFTLGNFSALDVFDQNSVVGDLRKSFFDEAFMTNSAWDFPADARGYSIGGAAELYWDQWAVRVMRLMPPVEPNSQTLVFQPFKYYGDQVEFEHDHVLFGDQPGAVRLLLYRNHELMGRFADAINAFEANPADNAANCGTLYNYGSENPTAPDLCFVRKTNVKVGIGFNAEQSITPNIGVFFRAMYSDGRTEVEAYDSADRSATVGTKVKGALWGQPLDSAGLGFGTSWISAIHAKYLEMGGVDGFIGDGALTQAHENMTEIYYRKHISRSIYLSADYQRVWNPGYNAARGPVNLFGGKFHVEF